MIILQKMTPPPLCFTTGSDQRKTIKESDLQYEAYNFYNVRL